MKKTCIIGTSNTAIALSKDVRRKDPSASVVFLSQNEQETANNNQETPNLEGCPVYRFDQGYFDGLDAHAKVEIIICDRSLSYETKKTLYLYPFSKPLWQVKILPKTFSALENPQTCHLRNLELSHILFEDTAPKILPKNIANLQNKRILITGAGGTLGSELAIQLLHSEISELYLLGHGELSVFSIHEIIKNLQMQGVGSKIRCVPVLCELIDKNMVEHNIRSLNPDIIFHFAAHKYVNFMEQYPFIGMASNVFGTKFLLDAAKEQGVEQFVFISTDKVIEPASIYGASKLITEELVSSSYTEQLQTLVLRSGNIIASRGSVLPIFEEQLLNGYPLTLTSKECTRYFISCPELASLLLFTSSLYLEKTLNKTPEKNTALLGVYKDNSTKIYDLAKKILDIHKQGKQKEQDITLIGLRDGEKIHEELFATWEKVSDTTFPNLSLVERESAIMSIVDIDRLLQDLFFGCYLSHEKSSAYHNRESLVASLRRHIPSFCTEKNTN